MDHQVQCHLTRLPLSPLTRNSRLALINLRILQGPHVMIIPLQKIATHWVRKESSWEAMVTVQERDDLSLTPEVAVGEENKGGCGRF